MKSEEGEGGGEGEESVNYSRAIRRKDGVEMTCKSFFRRRTFIYISFKVSLSKAGTLDKRIHSFAKE